MAVQTYVADGFSEDCLDLIHTLTERHKRVDWHKFCDCWKEMEFDILFYGRQSSPEVVELTEELLQVARLYIVTETDTFESQVIGLFIAYAITIIQPYKNLCPLRLVPKDIPALKKIEAMARRDNRWDILMILGKMYIYGKVHFHVAPRERAMDISIRKYYDGSTNVPAFISRRWYGKLDRKRVSAFEDIAQTESIYMDLKLKAKQAAEAVFPGINVRVDMFKPEAQNMAESLRKLTSGDGTNRDEPDSHVSTVKKKAMKRTVDSMRHLNSVVDRQKNNETAQSPKSSTSTAKTKKNKNAKLHSPLHPSADEAQNSGISPPSFDELPNLEEGASWIRQPSPEAPFRGFSNTEVKTSEDNLKAGIGKGKGKGKTSIKTQKTPSKINNQSPASSGKRKNNSSDNETKKKKKRKVKNKLNRKLRLRKDFISDDSNTDEDDLEEQKTSEKPSSAKDIPTTSKEPCKEVESTTKAKEQPCKVKALSIQTKGTVKHFVDYEMNDIVIRTEKDAPPKDIEIEYIDNYNGANDVYEEICELSDDEVKKEVLSISSREDEVKKEEENDDILSISSQEEVEVTVEECDEYGDTQNEDDMEVFQVVFQDPNPFDSQTYEKSKKNTPNNNVPNFKGQVHDTMQKILSKPTSKVERQRLKQPNLKSKLKKMGLLPLTNFEDDS